MGMLARGIQSLVNGEVNEINRRKEAEKNNIHYEKGAWREKSIKSFCSISSFIWDCNSDR